MVKHKMITFKWLKKPQKVRAKLLKFALKQTLNHYGYENSTIELSIYFCDDQTIRKLNKAYRNMDTPTDVLSFSYTNNPPNILLAGEIVISLDTARHQAKFNGKSLEDELGELLIHGLLHIFGKDDKTHSGYQKMKSEGEILWVKAKELY